ncbi:MAG: hypothetical protein DRJ01_08670 [Bacteroidetes bacterium]|nr:MAG: hypothetical protein DRJ01_08670 [Bacteroidota bacterium]
MKRQIIFFALIVMFFLLFIACNKKEGSKIISGGVELYLLESYETIGNTFQINESTVITKKSPLINYSNFIFYDLRNHVFKISDNAKQSIQNIEFSVHGLAFAIKADNNLIYTGYFLPSYSSMSCNWIVIDPTMLSLGNELKVELGYPGQIEGTIIPDKRNDKQILDIFKRDNKLIE